MFAPRAVSYGECHNVTESWARGLTICCVAATVAFLHTLSLLVEPFCCLFIQGVCITRGSSAGPWFDRSVIICKYDPPSSAKGDCTEWGRKILKRTCTMMVLVAPAALSADAILPAFAGPSRNMFFPLHLPSNLRCIFLLLIVLLHSILIWSFSHIKPT